jgi:carbamoyl-phosphate synthase large subunit
MKDIKTVKKVLVLGSGALKIGEAGEFDYSGSQAIKALKEEGIKTVLVNPNIATIQTSKFLADSVYFLPVNPYFVEQVIKKEKPDCILLSFGGQTALNCGLALHESGILKKHNVTILGTPISAIQLSEDRKAFAEHLGKIGVPTPESKAATSTKQALEIAEKLGFPVMVRAGFALGGQGSGIATNKTHLEQIANNAFAFVKQILVEKYLHHYKEVEYEVVRDKDDNCITVCNMENMDPLGIHTGESVVVAPSQTLTNYEYHLLRSEAIKIVRSLKIVGECNVQFALNPFPNRRVTRAGEPRAGAPALLGQWETRGAEAEGRARLLDRRGSGERQDPSHSIEYYVIELNARLSRSSALASKATGYPLAYVAAKLALGKNLTELQNKVTKATQFCFEPALDYITVKIPRWDINKFKHAEESIGSSMKSVGEVMGIGRNFAEAYQKAIRMLDLEFDGAISSTTVGHGKEIKEQLEHPTPTRMFALAQALDMGMSVEEIYKLTGIDPWFLYRIKNIVDHKKEIPKKLEDISKDHMLKLKQIGFSDKYIGEIVGTTGLEVRKLRKKYGITPSVFQIDTLAGEFPAKTNYLYTTYNGNHNDVEPTGNKGVIVLGSGPYRIGSSVEFDWTSVNTVLQLKNHKKQTIIINCNPETVSTDYDISDRLYFEELTFERIADIYEFENPEGIVISVGGQTPNNRAHSLKNYGFSVLGTDPTNIDRAEDRNKFSALLDTLGIDQPAWNTFSTMKALLTFCESVGYPVLIRPSYVLSGTMMRICHTKEELTTFINQASYLSKDYPITVSKFIQDAKEIELDAVAQNGKLITAVISEHVENAGVHSGDATIVLPPQKMYVQTKKKIEEIGTKIAEALQISGPVNMQFLAKENSVSVIEVNLRASRTFPFISKVTGVDFIQLAVDAFFDVAKPIAKNPFIDLSNKPYVAVKVAQFSFARLTGADPMLHVEMASTGEVACFGNDVEEAFLIGELAVGGKIPKKGIFISLGGEENKVKFLQTAFELKKLGIALYATEKTAAFLDKNGIKVQRLYKIHEKKAPNVLTLFQKGMVDVAINLVDTHVKKDIDDDYMIRRSAVDHNIPIYTNRQKAELFIKAICLKTLETLPIKSWDEYVQE